MPRFHVADAGSVPETAESGDFVLFRGIWNDWYTWRTLHTLYRVDSVNGHQRIGNVKIADVTYKQYANSEDNRTPLGSPFTRLSSSYVSVGQDESYYENLLAYVGANQMATVLRALRDLAFTPSRIDDVWDHPVVSESLFRGLSTHNVAKKFNRIAHGGSELVPYKFEFVQPPDDERDPDVRLEFDVRPDSEPPTNVHVLIGRNGSGKTRLLHSMARELLGTESEKVPRGRFESVDDAGPGFGNLVFVSFSAFDTADIPSEAETHPIGYSRIGLQDGDRTLSPVELAKVFAVSAVSIFQAGLELIWKDALETLESDKNFRDAAVADFVERQYALGEDGNPAATQDLFERLSSGHKIVLLTMTRLVESVSSRSLVLLDEPEAHLHPPLLSAFVRALSDLMQTRNGVAIAATHSPVLLQEVPRECALVVRRSGGTSKVDRPVRETFGENVGVLTHDVFSLEVTQSGFYHLLLEAAEETDSYEELVKRFGSQLGGEARALLRAWFAARGSH